MPSSTAFAQNLKRLNLTSDFGDVSISKKIGDVIPCDMSQFSKIKFSEKQFSNINFFQKR